MAKARSSNRTPVDKGPWPHYYGPALNPGDGHKPAEG